MNGAVLGVDLLLESLLLLFLEEVDKKFWFIFILIVITFGLFLLPYLAKIFLDLKKLL
jgi:hypothetical protein